MPALLDRVSASAHHRVDRLLEGEVGGVDDHGVGGLRQRGDGSGRVDGVAAPGRRASRSRARPVDRRRSAPGCDAAPVPRRSLSGTPSAWPRGTPPCRCRAPRPRCHRVDGGPLQHQQSGADFGDRAHGAHVVGDSRLPDGRGDIHAVEGDRSARSGRRRTRDIGFEGMRGDGDGIVEGHPVVEHPQGHRPIHRAGVQVAEPEPLGDAAGDAGLAGTGRAVDGDHRRGMAAGACTRWAPRSGRSAGSTRRCARSVSGVLERHPGAQPAGRTSCGGW